jgi:NTE family protein
MNISRRNLFVAGSGVVLASTLPSAAAEAKSSKNSFVAGWDDGLAHPIPYRPSPGQGKERGLVLGGGGTYLMAWMVGYFHALKSRNVDVSLADIVVGTSAGSFVGAALTSGRLWRIGLEFDVMAELPKLFAELMPQTAPNVSQVRAAKMSVDARNARPETIRAIGHAAMAARNPDNMTTYPKMTERFLGETAWPSPKLYTTANDCYTGERIVVSHEDNIPINVACAASSSLPGGLGPTFLKDRLCMDGGICQTSTHSDVVSGVKRALIISLTDGGSDAVKIGLRTSGMPNTLQQEVKDLQAGGTKVKLKVVGLLPGVNKVDSIVDPKWIAPLLKWGYERGLTDAVEMKSFWNA